MIDRGNKLTPYITRIIISFLSNDGGYLPNISLGITGIQPGRERWLLAGGLSDDIDTERMERARSHPVNFRHIAAALQCEIPFLQQGLC